VVTIAVELEDAKAVLDIAVGSMDFGSGFLDREEVATLRRLAVQIGVDPIVATPEEWRLQYAHAWTPETKRRYHWDRRAPVNDRVILAEDYIGCEHCPQAEDDPVHHGQDALTDADTAEATKLDIVLGRTPDPDDGEIVPVGPTIENISIGDVATATVERRSR
jgi:hypothetical protein